MNNVSDISPDPEVGVGYDNTAAQVWAERALEYWEQRVLQVAAFSTHGVVSVQVWGPCPRCAHALNVQKTLTAPIGEVRGWWQTVTGCDRHSESLPIPATVEVGCGCDSFHGAPAGQHGCGVSFHFPTSPPPASGTVAAEASPPAP